MDKKNQEIVYIKTRANDVLALTKARVYRMAGANQDTDFEKLFSFNGLLAGAYFLSTKEEYEKVKRGKPFKSKTRNKQVTNPKETEDLKAVLAEMKAKIDKLEAEKQTPEPKSQEPKKK